jgi:cellulose synthase/poly-beta-1,6-N-acetylglucosamine synthase-like glycosyltransferase
MKISVLVPTYRRSKDLERCLEALKQQSFPADEVLVVVRDTDEETHQFLGGFATGSLPLKIVEVVEPGQVAALNSGLEAAIGDIISITDDDAAPHGHWLAAIRQHFLSDPLVGGVGGRDWLYIEGKLFDINNSVGASHVVGKLTWFGRAIGNHHVGEGEPREVDILKGANMSYRRESIQGLKFDANLRGTGAQVCNDMAFSLSVKRQGWKLIYDPYVSVDHFSAERLDEDKRYAFNPKACRNRAFNESIVALKNITISGKIAYLFWCFTIGTRDSFGLAQLIRFFPVYGLAGLLRMKCSIEGRLDAFLSLANTEKSQT